MALTLDGYATGGTGVGSTSTATVTLTTSSPNDVIVLYVLTCGHSGSPGNPFGPVQKVADTAGLTWKRRQVIGLVQDQNLEIWWAYASGILSGDVITVTFPGYINQDIALAAIGINGANTTSPWDVNSSLPSYASNGGSGQPTATYSTTAVNTMVLAFWGSDGSFLTSGIPSGYTDAIGGSFKQGNAAADVAYKLQSSAQTNSTAQFSDTAGTSNDRTVVVDAIVAAAETGNTTGPIASFDGSAVINSNGSVTTANTTTDGGTNITTYNSGTVLFCYVATYTSGASQSVSSVILDPSGLNMAFTKRGSTTLAGSPNMSMELWWLAPGQTLSNKEVAVTMAGAVGSLDGIVFGVDNVNSVTAPFDTHSGLPVGASNSASATIQTTGVSTNAADTLIISGAADTQNDNNLFYNNPAPFGVIASLRNTGGGNDLMLGVFAREEIATVSSGTFSTGHTNSNWIMLTDAIALKVPPAPIDGTLASTEAADTFNMHGGLLGGHWTSTEAKDIMNFSPYNGPYGFWDSTDTTDATNFTGSGAIGTTWDPVTASSGIDFQDNNLAVVNTAAWNQAVGARSTTAHTTGKWYVEFQVRLNAAQSGVGIANASATFPGFATTEVNESNGSAVNGAGIFQNQNGTIWVNGVEQSNWQGLALSNVTVSMAVDLDNALIWFRVGSGNWNGIAGGNPATGIDGYSLAGLTGGPMYLYTTLVGALETAIMNAGSSAFTYSVPSGFSAWSSVEITAPKVQLDGYGTAGINEGGTRASPIIIYNGSVSLTTTQHDDVIVCLVAMGGYYNACTVDHITSTSSLTWKRRNQRWQSGGSKFDSTVINKGLDIEVWWAHAPNPLSGEEITVYTGAAGVGGMALIAFGVSGANYAAPFDTHTQAGGYVENQGNIYATPGVAQLSTYADNAFLFGFHADTQADAEVTQAPWTYVTSVDGNEVAGTPSYGSLVYQTVAQPQTMADVVMGQYYPGYGNVFIANSIMFDSIVAAGETGTAEEIYWFWDAGTANGITQLSTTNTNLALSYGVTNYNLMVLMQITIQTQSGTAEVTSISESAGQLSSSGFERRSRVVTPTPNGTIAVEIWWGYMPMPTEKASNDTLTINTSGTESGDIIAAQVWGIGGTTGSFGFGDPFWDPHESLPAEGSSSGMSPYPNAQNISTITPSTMLVAWTSNITEKVNFATEPFITLVQDYPATIVPVMTFASTGPDFFMDFEFLYSPGLASNETAQFVQSPSPDGWIVIADAIPVGPPQPPTGIWGSTENKDTFAAHGFLPIQVAWHSTEHTDTCGGAPQQAPYLGEGWIGWVPAHATWASTEAIDQMGFYGWVIASTRGITGQIVAMETKDRLSFSNRSTVTGTWGSNEYKDRWSSSGFLIPKVVPPAPIKRRLLIIT